LGMNDWEIPQPAWESLDALNEQCGRQPGLFYEYSRRCEDARDAMERAEAELESTIAEIGLQYRRNGIDGVKTTDKAIEAAVLSDVRYKYRKQKYMDIKKEYNDLKVVVDAFHQKKFMMSTISANIRKEQETGL
jgi:hypothetical protein